MTEIIQERLNQLTLVVDRMNTTQIREGAENSRLMEKLVDGQNLMTTAMAEKTAYDKANFDRLIKVEASVLEHNKLLNSLEVKAALNTEVRKDIIALRRRILGIVFSMIMTAALLAYEVNRHGS